MSDAELKKALGELVIVSFPGDKWNDKLARLIDEYKVAGFIHFADNIKSGSGLIELNRKIREAVLNAGQSAPFISVDEEGGRVSRLSKIIGKFPAPKELAECDDEMVEASFYSMGLKIKELGFNITWAPLLDINTNEDNPVIGDRSFSNDAGRVSKMAKVAMRGLSNAGLLKCGKHFPGHGDTSVDSHISLPSENRTMEELKQRELIPFKMAVDENVDFLMTAHILFTQIEENLPATFSKQLLKTCLRQELGFKGVVVTDDLNMEAVKENYSLTQRIELSINGGADILLIRDDNFNGLIKFMEQFYRLVASGEILEARIEESLIRVRKVKQKLNFP